jgi:hypothetical protein
MLTIYFIGSVSFKIFKEIILHLLKINEVPVFQRQYNIKVASSCHNYVDVIDQKYLEAGHTQMECDSMHAAIEYAKRKTNVFIPSQWDTIIHMTRRSNLYIVLPLKYWDFI